MRHFYRKILSYNPIKKEVVAYEAVGENDIFNTKKQDKLFQKIWESSNHIQEVVLAFTVSNDMYQLSEASYGYIKEDPYSAGTIKKGAVLRAIDIYRMDHKLSFD